MLMVDTFYIHLKFNGKNGGWSINLPFLCNQCGVCCTLDDFLTAGEVKINSLENPKLHAKIRAIYDEIGKIWEDNEEKYDHFITQTQCPFLSNKTCSIYDVRPDGCRQFPNTKFGMLTEDCEALTRFKKQCSALKRGRITKGSYHFTTKEPIKRVRFTDKEYESCVLKLRKAGVTTDELSLFNQVNGKT